MKPGATMGPAGSMVSRASSSIVPTATMRPSFTPTSAGKPGAPVPSTTVPPTIFRSSIVPPRVLLLGRFLEFCGVCFGAQDRDALEPAMALEIGDAAVQRRPVVPEGDVADVPVE